MSPRPRTAIAIPAKDEAERIGACLEALAAQTCAPDDIVLCINNTSDRTAEIAGAVRLPGATRLHLLVRDLPPPVAHVGAARRLAMDAACELAGPGGVVLTTDADGMADPSWLGANLDALAEGAGAVAGWVSLDEASWAAIPRRLHEDDARECAYDALCDELHARLDPDPFDPWPRHTQNSGASLAIRVPEYVASGGLPPLPSGEDRALVAALRRMDVGIRHAPECHVTVSGRIEGRAPGGMADTIRRRLAAPDEFIDDRLEPAADCARRARLRGDLRRALTDFSAISVLAEELEIEAAWLRSALRQRPFGTVWAAIETRSSTLRRRLVAIADLPAQIRLAQALCDGLRDAEAALRPGLALAG